MKKKKCTTDPEKNRLPAEVETELDMERGVVIHSNTVIHSAIEIERKPRLPHVVPATTASDVISIKPDCMVRRD